MRWVTELDPVRFVILAFLCFLKFSLYECFMYFFLIYKSNLLIISMMIVMMIKRC